MDDFGEFYAVTKDGVFRAILVATGDRAGAEDASAEAYARACARWSRLREHPNPKAWVLRTALNVRRSWWRRTRRELLGAVPEHGAEDTASIDLDADLRRAVAALPTRQREVVALRVLADLSAEDTGELLGIAPATVHVHLHRALSALRLQFGEEVVG
ncbi:RNA polymerase sigma factor [Phytohabitans flavus]|nr:sigma-70 family RNA polymerase sigma factor [Phytohabitans flavus]